jgi:hypothetical protein
VRWLVVMVNEYCGVDIWCRMRNGWGFRRVLGLCRVCARLMGTKTLCTHYFVLVQRVIIEHLYVHLPFFEVVRFRY